MPIPVVKEVEYFIKYNHKKHIIGEGKKVFPSKKGLLFWDAKILRI